MAAAKNLTDDRIAAIRQRHIDGVPISQIAAEFDICPSTATYWIDGGPKHTPRHLPPLPRGRQTRRGRKMASRAARTALVDRLWRAANRQVQEIEDRLAVRKRAGGEDEIGERDARMLAVLVKTLRELAALNETNKEAAAAAALPQPDPDHDDPVPRDIDEFRRELARRIEALVGSRRDGGVRSEPQR
jgi:transposase-like protein